MEVEKKLEIIREEFLKGGVDYTKSLKQAFNLGVQMAAENAEVLWVENPKLSDPDHETAIVNEESILKLLLK
jgi:hypothetical protein